MSTTQEPKAEDIEPGMVVETTKGDLGEQDVTKPKVAEVVTDQNGNVEDIVVEKGVLFKKKLEIPVDRIKSVDSASKPGEPEGEVTIDVSEEEAEALKPYGEEVLTPDDENGILEEAQRNIPTPEGLREMEAENIAGRAERPELKQRNKLLQVLYILGPGFITGMAGNDSTAVTSYSIDGSTAGYGHLWLMFLSTPLYQSVQFACAKIGRITQKGMADILREYYGRWVAVLATLLLIVANIALIAGNLVAIGSGLELITGISWVWFVIPVAVLLWYFTIYHSFEAIKKFFLVLSLAFVVYVITAIFSGANWGALLIHTFIPQISFGFASISAAVALLGATISPYTMFWQVQGEKEQQRAGSTSQKLREAALDIATGVISGNLVAYFIIVTTATTLFTHHQSINTAADAARALAPLLGPFAKYLFAIGLIGAGLVAIPVFLASTSYAVAGTFGWPEGLSKKPWQAEGFYLILTGALVVSLVLALLRIDPIKLIFYANVLVGILAPVMVVFVILVGNNRKIMKNQRLSLLNNIFLVITALIMGVAAILFFYGLFSGQGG